MTLDIKPYIVHEQYLADHRVDKLRTGEGSVVVLPDNSLLTVYTRFSGGHDSDYAILVQQRSADGGRTWSKPKQLIPTPKNVQNLMSVSLLLLADGRLACAYLIKTSLEDCRPLIIFSSNQGKTWTKPVQVIDDKDVAFYVVNNDRMVQLASGRLILPFANHGYHLRAVLNAKVGCAYSDDGGKTWQLGTQQSIDPENVALPRNVDLNNTHVMKYVVEMKRVSCQEPGVVEMPDGRLMLWCRTDGGYMYYAMSTDGGINFSPLIAMRTFAMPCGPQSIKRLPGTDRLFMLFNDRHHVAMGEFQFEWRRTLNIAVSDDNAKTWKAHGLLEPNTVPSTCYYSICFHNKNAVFTYYEGCMETDKEGRYYPDNLRSLKLKIVKQAYFNK